METLPISKFKATCLAVLEDVRKQKKKVLITKRGEPIAEIAPVDYQKEEIALIKKILQLQDVLNICHKTLDPYALTVYLQEVAEAFHKFYDLHRVLGQEEALTHARLALIQAARVVLATGLGLMRISRPESM